jgi:polyisoprenoid-binding protein YceI
MKRNALALLAALVLAVPASAQQAGPTTDLAKVEGGDYEMDGGHTRILFAYTHFGFSTSSGFFSQSTAKLHFDPKAPTKSTLDVAIDLNGIDTTVAKLDEHLKGPAFFDVAKFPTASFKANAIAVTGPNTGTVTGDLTVHGVTKPVTLDVTFNGGAPHPMAKVFTLGFNATGHLKRSDFGIGAYAPAVSDDITLTISTEFRKVQ